MRDMRCPNAQKEDNTRVSRLATGRQCRVVHMVRRVDAKAPARERLPEQALVRARVAVRIRLDPGIAGRREGRVARLQRERVDEQVQEDNIALRARRVRARSRREAVLRDERRVHVVQEVRPHLADVYNFIMHEEAKTNDRL